MQDASNLEAFYMATRLTLRLDFDTGARLGPGKVALLEAVDRTGSIAAAGRTFGMSYRRAWLLIDEVNRTFSEPLVAARGGGRNGGGAVLTDQGRRIVDLYRAAEAAVRRSTAREIAQLANALANGQGTSPSGDAPAAAMETRPAPTGAGRERRDRGEPARPLPLARVSGGRRNHQAAKPLA